MVSTGLIIQVLR